MKSFREFCEYLHRIEYQQEFDWARTEEIAVRLVAQYEGRLVNSEVSVTPRQGTSYITALYVAWRMCYDPCDMLIVSASKRSHTQHFNMLVSDILTRQAITQLAPRVLVDEFDYGLVITSKDAEYKMHNYAHRQQLTAVGYHHAIVLPCNAECGRGWIEDYVTSRAYMPTSPLLQITY